MGYLLTRDSNEFTIMRTGPDDLFVTVYVQTHCDLNEFEVVIPEQQVDVQVVITLPEKDGLYKILISDKDTLNEEILVASYKEFLGSLIDGIKYVLCGCKCDDCDDCGKSQKDYLSVLVKMFAYNVINDGIYTQFLMATNNCVKCNILDINQCLLINETILGNADNSLLMKQIIAYYYLVYYYTDLKINNQNTDEVNQLYDYKNIIKCIKKLGIDENCINENIVLESLEGIFTFEFNTTFT